MKRQLKCIAIFASTFVLCALLSSAAQAQWVRRYYAPMFVAPRPAPVFVAPQPVFMAPQPVVRVNRGPMVVYQPSRVVYSRRRPVLGGTVVRSAPAYRRTVIW